MSIDVEEFDKHKNPLKYIVDYLRNNKERAYTIESIAKAIRIDVIEVRNALFYDGLAKILDPRYGSLIESATVAGVVYYRYKGQ
jgi:DNA-directed RNA polymerase specialized sigma subunit